IHCFFLFFFFSSRRRHTRCLSDWSSDVCSSDLAAIDLDVLVFLLGVMLIVGYLEVGKFFEWAAEWVLRRARTHQRLLFCVVVGGGLLSALFVNDTVCLVVTPVLLAALGPL